MGISPWYKTTTPTAPIWTIQLIPDSGLFDVTSLTTSNFALLLKNVETGAETSGVGTFSNITVAVPASTSGSPQVATPASVQYQAAAADVTLGTFRVYVLVTTSYGVQPFLFDEAWEVVSL